MSDRPVATDALATLGTIIDDAQKRDAIHLAVEPMIAGESLSPGEHVFIRDSKAYGNTGATNTPPLLGIVDPFLTDKVRKGHRFWLLVYPRVITSLRHVWAHPAFPDEAPTAPSKDDSPQAVSRRWIEEFASRLDQTYSRLMAAAALWIETDDGKYGGEYTYDNTEAYKAHWDQFPDFWKHYEVVTGTKPRDPDASFFTCSC